MLLSPNTLSFSLFKANCTTLHTQLNLNESMTSLPPAFLCRQQRQWPRRWPWWRKRQATWLWRRRSSPHQRLPFQHCRWFFPCGKPAWQASPQAASRARCMATPSHSALCLGGWPATPQVTQLTIFYEHQVTQLTISVLGNTSSHSAQCLF